MQTQEFFQDSDFEGLEPVNQLSFFHPTTTGANANSATDATAITAFFSEPQCTSCGFSMKRKSPSFPTSEPKPKKLSAQEDDDYHRHSSIGGFTKIDLPIPFSTTTASNPPPSSSSSPVLRRSFSDVCNNAGTSPPDSLTGSSTAFLMNNPQSPESYAIKATNPNAAAATTPSPNRGSSVSPLPPWPPLLVRSVSDPTSLFPVPGPAPTTKNSRPSSSGEMDGIPNLKRLRRMKERMIEMNQWLDELVHEGEADDSENDNSTHKQDALNLDTGADHEEVSVERLGECLRINFRCPCGTGYQILLSGKHCYYKLL